MRKMVLRLCSTVLFCTSTQASAQSFISGTLSDITSTKEGLLVRLTGNILPSGCNDPYGWMLIKASSQTMISVALSSWLSGQRQVTIYVDPPPPETTYCEVVQYDPH